jgi:small subunit ribosomal protein S17
MKRTLIGKVVSDKMEKTIVVSVEGTKEHPIYKKKYTVSSKFSAHDENNKAKEGDMVKIEESRPLSRNKRWNLVKVLTAKDLES